MLGVPVRYSSLGLAVLLTLTLVPTAMAAASVSVGSNYVSEGGTVQITYSGLASGNTIEVKGPTGTHTYTVANAAGSVVFPTDFSTGNTHWAGVYEVKSGGATATFTVGAVEGGATVAKATPFNVRGTGYSPGADVTVRLLDSGGNALTTLPGPLRTGLVVKADNAGVVTTSVTIPHALADGNYLLELISGAQSPAKAGPDRSPITLTAATAQANVIEATSGNLARMSPARFDVRLTYGGAPAVVGTFPLGLKAVLTDASSATTDLFLTWSADGRFKTVWTPAIDTPLGTATLRVPAQDDAYGNHVTPFTVGQITVAPAIITPEISFEGSNAPRLTDKDFTLVYTYPDDSLVASTDLSPSPSIVHTDSGAVTACPSAACEITSGQNGWTVRYVPPADAPAGATRLKLAAGSDVHGNTFAALSSAIFQVTPAPFIMAFSQTLTDDTETDAYLWGDTILMQGTISYPDGSDVPASRFADGGVRLFITRADGSVDDAEVKLEGALWTARYPVTELDPAGPARITFFAIDLDGNTGEANVSTFIGLRVDVDVTPGDPANSADRGGLVPASTRIYARNLDPVTLDGAPEAELWRGTTKIAGPDQMTANAAGGYDIKFKTSIDQQAGPHKILVKARATNGQVGLGIGTLELLPSPLLVTNVSVAPRQASPGDAVTFSFDIKTVDGKHANTTGLAPKVKATTTWGKDNQNITTIDLTVTKTGNTWRGSWTPTVGDRLGQYVLTIDGQDTALNQIAKHTESFSLVPGVIEVSAFQTSALTVDRLGQVMLTFAAAHADGTPYTAGPVDVELLRPGGTHTELQARYDASLGKFVVSHTFRHDDALTDGASGGAQGYRFRLSSGELTSASGEAGPAIDLVTPHIRLRPTSILISNATLTADGTSQVLRFEADYPDGTPVAAAHGPPGITWGHVRTGQLTHAITVRHVASTGGWEAIWDASQTQTAGAVFVIEGVDALGNKIVGYESLPMEKIKVLDAKEEAPGLGLIVPGLLLVGLAFLRRRR